MYSFACISARFTCSPILRTNLRLRESLSNTSRFLSRSRNNSFHSTNKICGSQSSEIRSSIWRLLEASFSSTSLLQRQKLGDSFFTSIRCAHRRSYSKATFEMNKNLPRDVLVFSHNNDNFYTMLSYFGIFQMAMWGYLSLFAIQHLKSSSSPPEDTEQNTSWWKRFLYKEGQYKNALSVLCFFVGAAVMFITLTYPRRAIRNLWILKGGNQVKITTYSWLGRRHTFQESVEHINCVQSRQGPGPHIPLKIKGKNFFYLLDKQGSFHNTDLFDFVIGVKRKL